MSDSPAGWYPQEDGRLRWWDGTSWTEEFTAAVPQAGSGTVPALWEPDSTGDQTAGRGGLDPSEGNGSDEPRGGRRWFAKKRVLIPAGLLALFVVIGSLSGGDADPSTAAVGATSTPSVAPTASGSTPTVDPSAAAQKAKDEAAAKAKADAAAKAKAAADAAAKAKADAAAKVKAAAHAAAKAKADAAAKAKAAADAKAKAKADAAARAASAAAPYNEAYGSFTTISKSGRGDSVVALPKGAEAGLVTLTHKGGSNFAVNVLDSSNQATGDLLVNEIGSYAGTTIYGLSSFGGTPAKLKIVADGAWTLKVAPVSSAPRLPTAITGKGDKVFLYDGDAADWAITHKGGSNFVVTQAGGSFPNLAINEIGGYQGVVPLDAGPSVITVMADGAWSIKRQ